MKNFIKEYLKIIAISITGFVFVLTSFYFVINYYHSEEVKKQVYIGQTDPKLVAYKDNVDRIKNNLDAFQKKRITAGSYLSMYNNLNTCYTTLKDNFYNIETNRYYSSNDIYNLGGKFQSEVLNLCWALHLSSIKESNINDFKKVSPLVTSEVNSISKKTNYALEEIMNNSSYFYTTRITSVTIRNYLTSDYNMIVDSYQDFSSIILYLSELLNEGGN